MREFMHFLRANTPWLLAGFFLTFASGFGQTFFIAVFAGEIRAEFDLTHGSWGSLYAFATMASAAVMIFAGGLPDRFRVRHIGAGVLAGLAGAALAMAMAQALWALILALFALRLFGQGLMGHMSMVAMARWFVATRGRAVSIAGLGVAAAEALLPITFVALLGIFDWRLLWIAAAMVLLALTPVLYTLLRSERTPQSFAAETGSTGMSGRMWTRNAALRHWLFWAMVPVILGPAAWNTAFFFHQVHVADAKGWTHLELAALFPLFTAASIGFMLLAGWFVDRFGTTRLAMFYLLPLALGYGLLSFATVPTFGAIAMVLMGASAGMNTTMMATFWADFYGTRHLGAIRATIAAVMVLGTALGPAITGRLIDLGLTLPEQALGIALYFALCAVVVGFATQRAAQRCPSMPTMA